MPANRPTWLRMTRGARWQLGLATALACTILFLLPFAGHLQPTWTTAVVLSFWWWLHYGPAMVLAGTAAGLTGAAALAGETAMLVVAFLLFAALLVPLRLAIDRPVARARWLRAQVLAIALYLLLVAATLGRY